MIKLFSKIVIVELIIFTYRHMRFRNQVHSLMHILDKIPEKDGGCNTFKNY